MAHRMCREPFRQLRLLHQLIQTHQFYQGWTLREQSLAPFLYPLLNLVVARSLVLEPVLGLALVLRLVPHGVSGVLFSVLTVAVI